MRDMKKLIALILLVSLVIFSGIPVFAEDKADISFDTYSSEESGNICVDVLISESGNPAMMQFCIAYDGSILECLLASAGNAFSGNNAPIINKTDGKIYFIWDSLTPLGPGGTMLHLEFAPVAEKDTTVGIDPSETFIVANPNFEEIGVVTGSAEIDLTKDEPVVSPLPPSSDPDDDDSSEGAILGGTEGSIDISEELEKEAEITEEDNAVMESGDENVAVIEDGKIVPVSPGTTTITVTTEDGEKEATVEITVKEDGTVETQGIEVLTGNAPKESSSGWVIIIPIAAVLVAAFALILRKIKNR